MASRFNGSAEISFFLLLPHSSLSLNDQVNMKENKKPPLNLFPTDTEDAATDSNYQKKCFAFLILRPKTIPAMFLFVCKNSCISVTPE